MEPININQNPDTIILQSIQIMAANYHKSRSHCREIYTVCATANPHLRINSATIIMRDLHCQSWQCLTGWRHCLIPYEAMQQKLGPATRSTELLKLLGWFSQRRFSVMKKPVFYLKSYPSPVRRPYLFKVMSHPRAIKGKSRGLQVAQCITGRADPQMTRLEPSPFHFYLHTIVIFLWLYIQYVYKRAFANLHIISISFAF